ncbi:MAG TPA: gluconokinase, partial [Chloroflexota bacterium]|nr:gluconokinase [Chloroflexota bacterium]
IGLSTVMHSLIVVDAAGRPLTPTIIWADTRSRVQIDQLRQEIDPTAWYQRTGCPVHPMYLAGKIRWLRVERPKLFDQAAYFGCVKDEIIARLTGRRVVDQSCASGSGLFNLHESRWDPEIMSTIGIPSDKLPELVEPTTIVGGIVGEVATRTGLPSGTPVIAGASDGVLSSLGSGSVAPGQMTVMIGTSGAARLVASKPVLDRAARTWCYYLAQNRWVAGGAINNGGLAVRWVREHLLPGPPAPADEFDFETLVADAQRASNGSGGLVFLPFMAGERAPFWNASARGVLFGLATHLGSAHVARSILEGVCFRMRSIVDALDDVAGPTTEIRGSGGFARSPFWTQMLADILGRPLTIPDAPQASAFGAAGLALIALGVMKSLDDVARLVPPGIGPTPSAEARAIYDRVYRLYLEIYWANSPLFTKVAQLQEDLG